MHKLEEAKKMLSENEEMTLAAVFKDGNYVSEKKGIAPMMDILETKPTLLEGASVADKVVGKAAALLFMKADITTLFAKTISEHAFSVLQKSKIAVSYENRVPYIINRSKTGMCPMEEAVLHTDDIEEAYRLLQAKMAQMKVQASKG